MISKEEVKHMEEKIKFLETFPPNEMVKLNILGAESITVPAKQGISGIKAYLKILSK
jgi:hypothetical protein